MGDAALVAEMLLYPASGRAAQLAGAVETVAQPDVAEALRAFCRSVEARSLGEWEELHTRTLDLSPLVVPYVGNVTWGENYRRGAFMAELSRAMSDAGVDTGGELPDHLVPVLRLLDSGAARPAELDGILPDAVGAMRSELARNDRRNPYLHVFDASRQVVQAIGAMR